MKLRRRRATCTFSILKTISGSPSSTTVLVYDLIGNLIETKALEVNSGNFQLDVSSYGNGMYLLELQTDGKLANGDILKCDS